MATVGRSNASQRTVPVCSGDDGFSYDSRINAHGLRPQPAGPLSPAQFPLQARRTDCPPRYGDVCAVDPSSPGSHYPIGEQTTPLSSEWYLIAYYAILILSSLLGGMLVSVVLMLYGTIRDLIEVIGLEREDSPILFPEEDSGDKD